MFYGFRLQAVWGPLDETIITGHDNGDLCKWDAKSGERIAKLREHKKGTPLSLNLLRLIPNDSTKKLRAPTTCNFASNRQIDVVPNVKHVTVFLALFSSVCRTFVCVRVCRVCVGSLIVWWFRAGIMDIQVSKDQGFFITASKDCSSKLFDMEEFRSLKLFKTERPVNSAAISPLKKHVVLGGVCALYSVQCSWCLIRVCSTSLCVQESVWLHTK